ncbi:hypothetical protein F4818DRAFT_435963 [Hypoxylon cercidicola]|nr:hypothetical protein F4818DRAFT_435963 [Hypoxylon cercidicola]
MSGNGDNKKDIPIEIWMHIIDILEREGDRNTLTVLARCNQNFLGLVRKPLYRRFISPLENVYVGSGFHIRPIKLFFRTIVESPMLRSYVGELKAEHLPNTWVVGSNHGDLSASLSIAGERVGFQFLEYFRQFGLECLISVTWFVELTMCFLPELKSIHLDLTSDGYFGYFLHGWKTRSPDNRLNNLKEVSLEYKATDKPGLDTSLVCGLLMGVAPRIQRLIIRKRYTPPMRHTLWLDQQQRPFSNLLDLRDELLRNLETLQELTLHCNHLGKWEEYDLVQHCKGLKTLTYIRDDEITPICKINIEFQTLDDPAHRWPPITDDVNCSLKSIDALETLTISQNAIIVGRINTGITDDFLDDFFPLSLRVLRIVDFDHDLYEPIQRFIGKLKSDGYNNLEVVELVPIPSTEEPTDLLLEDEENLVVALFAAVGVKCTFIKEASTIPTSESDVKE